MDLAQVKVEETRRELVSVLLKSNSNVEGVVAAAK
jgi:hypothetical protein